SQVGRFDPWEDPLGVIDAYRLVKRTIPEVQLLMIGSMAKDDPEGWLWFERTTRHAGDDPDIHFLTDLRGVGALEVNVLQRETDVALAKSLREGFGLIVSEALWKGVPVVGGDVGGIRIQVEDGTHGYLVTSVNEAAARTLTLLKDAALRKRMGQAGRDRVRREFRRVKGSSGREPSRASHDRVEFLRICGHDQSTVQNDAGDNQSHRTMGRPRGDAIPTGPRELHSNHWHSGPVSKHPTGRSP